MWRQFSPAYTASPPSSSSMRSNWLYLARRSDLQQGLSEVQAHNQWSFAQQHATAKTNKQRWHDLDVALKSSTAVHVATWRMSRVCAEVPS
jgi:hypothetical protein